MRGSFFATLLLCAPSWVDARPLYRGKVSITGFTTPKTTGLIRPKTSTSASPPTPNLGLIDLRATVLASRLWNERLDFKLDFRLRVTGSLDFERKYDPNTTLFGDQFYKTPLGTSARGYLGGREYDLREAYATFRPVSTWHIQVGRMYIPETDAIKIDGAKVAHDFGSHWYGSAFLAAIKSVFAVAFDRLRGAMWKRCRGHPQRYADADCRSADADCRRTERPSSVSRTAVASVSWGAGARYNYDVLWGSVGAAASFFLAWRRWTGDAEPVCQLADRWRADPAKPGGTKRFA